MNLLIVQPNLLNVRQVQLSTFNHRRILKRFLIAFAWKQFLSNVSFERSLILFRRNSSPVAFSRSQRNYVHQFGQVIDTEYIRIISIQARRAYHPQKFLSRCDRQHRFHAFASRSKPHTHSSFHSQSFSSQTHDYSSFLLSTDTRGRSRSHNLTRYHCNTRFFVLNIYIYI